MEEEEEEEKEEEEEEEEVCSSRKCLCPLGLLLWVLRQPTLNKSQTQADQ